MKKRILAIGIVLFVSLILLSSMLFANTEYTDWTETTKLPTKAGAYKLTTDVTITNTVTIGAYSGTTSVVTLDLNGHKVTFNGSQAHLYVQNAGSLIIEDSANGGILTNDGATAGSYIVYAKGNCQIEGGTLENTLANKTALYIQGDTKNATCTLNGGTIVNSYDRGGRAVEIGNKATFTMNGGKIKSLAGNKEGDIPAIKGGYIKMTGGTIEVEATRAIETTEGIIDAAGTAIDSNSTTVEITGGTIKADGYAFKTRYAVIDPAEGKEVNVDAGKAILNPYSKPNSGKGNQIFGGKFNAPELSRGIYPDNIEVYGGTYTNNDAIMDVTSYLKDATLGNDGTVTCNHTETYEEGAVEATCTAEGKTADVICSNCKKIVTKGTKIEKEKHTYGEWVIEKEPTYTEKGSKYQECSCGDRKTEEIEKLPEPEVDYVVPEDKEEGNNTSIGVVETETVKETLDTSLKADTELNKKVEEEKQKGNQVTVEIAMEELDNKDVKEEEKQKITETVKENQTVHQYFDISVLVKTSEKELGKLTQLTEKMKFSMEISEDLIKAGRKFFILKLHGDKVEEIEAVLNGTKLEFETDQFSTFALAYEDEKIADSGEKEEQPKEEAKPNVPNTGDNIVLYVVLAVIALTGIIVMKKANTKNTKK